jgi:Tfp pilus assembly protein PilF
MNYQTVSVSVPHSPGTYYNIALCYAGLQEMGKAVECVDRALELDPVFEDATALRIQLSG